MKSQEKNQCNVDVKFNILLKISSVTLRDREVFFKSTKYSGMNDAQRHRTLFEFMSLYGVVADYSWSG